MAQSEIQEVAPAAPEGEGTAASRGERVYPMSRDGRRQAIILLIGVATLWVFALWSLVTIFQDGLTGVEWVSMLLMLGMLVVAPVVAWTLLEEANSRIVTSERGIEYRTIGGINLAYKWDELSGFKPRGTRGRLARFFLGEEEVDITNNARDAEASVPRPGEEPTTEENERAVAVASAHVETDAHPVARPDRQADEEDELDEEDPETLLLQVRPGRTAEITNPITRFLHAQAHGSNLPIYGGLENRQELLEEISRLLRASSST